MQPDNKHKIFSKEELFKLIDEKKSLPPEADDFDKEALEGLSVLTNRNKVDGLNNSIDEVLRKEKLKEKKKRNLYILSAAASLVLIISFLFLLKNNSFDKKEQTLAENTKIVNETLKNDEPKSAGETTVEEKKTETGATAPVNITDGEAKGKEGKKLESKTNANSNQNISSGDVASVPPAEIAANVQTKTANRKVISEESIADRDEKNSGGKDYKASPAKDDQTKKAELKLEDKEKDKTRYLTNTVWTSTPSSGIGGATDEYKKKAADDKNQNQLDQNGLVESNNITSSPQKNSEQVAYEKQASKGPDTKTKSGKENLAKPDTVVTDMLAGYSYYDSKANNAPSGSQKTEPASPIQSETNADSVAVTSSNELRKESEESANKQKIAQETTAKKSKHEAKSDNGIAALQKTDDYRAAQNTTIEPAVFGKEKDALQNYIKKNLKISSPKNSGIIVIEFLIKKDGKIDTSTIKIITPIKNCDACNKDVVDLIKTMPPWKPSMENGKPVVYKQKLSINYNTPAVAK